MIEDNNFLEQLFIHLIKKDEYTAEEKFQLCENVFVRILAHSNKTQMIDEPHYKFEAVQLLSKCLKFSEIEEIFVLKSSVFFNKK